VGLDRESDSTLRVEGGIPRPSAALEVRLRAAIGREKE
jgi:hypothetical protein